MSTDNRLKYGKIKLTTAAPYYNSRQVEASFDSHILSGYKAIVIADSVSPGTSLNYSAETSPLDPRRLTTLLLKIPRCILPEINTHRAFSRNSASSRARNVVTVIRDVVKNPYIPLFTYNEPGMSGEFLNATDRKDAEWLWLEARDKAVLSAIDLLVGTKLSSMLPGENLDTLLSIYEEEKADGNALNIHKQHVNRLLEPFLWHEVLISATEWENFLNLRYYGGNVKPEMYATAALVKKVLEVSIPEATDMHLPFVGAFNEKISIKNAVLISASECARISYQDRGQVEPNPDITLGTKLLNMGHLSPFEHVAFTKDGLAVAGYSTGPYIGTNFSDTWTQARRFLA